MDDDTEYYAMRAKAERERTAGASEANVAAIHETLARKYEVLAAEVAAARRVQDARPIRLPQSYLD
jgi:hypothetical protein